MTVTPGSSTCLVIGADSLVGVALVASLEKSGARVMGTTRRQEMASGRNRIFFDLTDENAKTPGASRYSVAYFCAAVTSIAACEDDPHGTQRINVLGTIAVAKRLLAAGTPIVFLSSNAVFDGFSAWPDEDACYSPTCEYGRQKMLAEQQLLSLSTAAVPVTIVRLSKVLSSRVGIVKDFLGHLAKGEVCNAFEDLNICPISIAYAAEALSAVAASGRSGVFHLSGENEMNYVELGRHLARRLGTEPALVRPSSSSNSKTRVLFQPAHPGLGMSRTREVLGLDPETTAQLMTRLSREASSKVSQQ